MSGWLLFLDRSDVPLVHLYLCICDAHWIYTLSKFWLFTLISFWGSGGSHREANLVSGAGADCVDAARKVQLFIMCPHQSLPVVCFCWIFSSRDLRKLQCWQSHPLVQVYSVQPHKCNKKEKKSKLLYGLGNCGLFYWKLLGFSQRHSSHHHQWSSAWKLSQFETLMLKCKNIRKGKICWVFYVILFTWQLFDCTL